MLKRYFTAFAALSLLTFSSFEVSAAPAVYTYSQGQLCIQVRLQDHVIYGLNGPLVTLEDDSQMTVRSDDVLKLALWRLNDVVRLEPAPAGSGLRFLLVNERLVQTVGGLWTPNEAFVHADYVRGPLLASPFTHFIAGLDINMPGRKTVTLNNHTLWEIDERDLNLVMTWFINDTVIIGSNPVWWGAWRPSNTILINVEKNIFVRARQL